MDTTDSIRPTVTERRIVVAGAVSWAITEFDNGRSYMLVGDSDQLHVDAFFNADQWRRFRSLIVPCHVCGGRGTLDERPDADGNWDTCDACEGTGVEGGPE